MVSQVWWGISRNANCTDSNISISGHLPQGPPSQIPYLLKGGPGADTQLLLDKQTLGTPLPLQVAGGPQPQVQLPCTSGTVVQRPHLATITSHTN